MADERSQEAVPPEVDEADWLESHQAPDGALARPEPPASLGDRLGEAGEGDLVDSMDGEPSPTPPAELPADAPQADVLEQRQLPTGAGDGADLDEPGVVEEEHRWTAS